MEMEMESRGTAMEDLELLPDDSFDGEQFTNIFFFLPFPSDPCRLTNAGDPSIAPQSNALHTLNVQMYPSIAHPAVHFQCRLGAARCSNPAVGLHPLQAIPYSAAQNVVVQATLTIDSGHFGVCTGRDTVLAMSGTKNQFPSCSCSLVMTFFATTLATDDCNTLI